MGHDATIQLTQREIESEKIITFACVNPTKKPSLQSPSACLSDMFFFFFGFVLQPKASILVKWTSQSAWSVLWWSHSFCLSAYQMWQHLGRREVHFENHTQFFFFGWEEASRFSASLPDRASSSSSTLNGLLQKSSCCSSHVRRRVSNLAFFHPSKLRVFGKLRESIPSLVEIQRGRRHTPKDSEANKLNVSHSTSIYIYIYIVHAIKIQSVTIKNNKHQIVIIYD